MSKIDYVVRRVLGEASGESAPGPTTDQAPQPAARVTPPPQQPTPQPQQQQQQQQPQVKAQPKPEAKPQERPIVDKAANLSSCKGMYLYIDEQKKGWYIYMANGKGKVRRWKEPVAPFENKEEAQATADAIMNGMKAGTVDCNKLWNVDDPNWLDFFMKLLAILGLLALLKKLLKRKKKKKKKPDDKLKKQGDEKRKKQRDEIKKKAEEERKRKQDDRKKRIEDFKKDLDKKEEVRRRNLSDVERKAEDDRKKKLEDRKKKLQDLVDKNKKRLAKLKNASAVEIEKEKKRIADDRIKRAEARKRKLDSIEDDKRRIDAAKKELEDRKKRIDALDDKDKKKKLLDELEKDKKRIQDLEDKLRKNPPLPPNEKKNLKNAEDDARKKNTALAADESEQKRKRRMDTLKTGAANRNSLKAQQIEDQKRVKALKDDLEDRRKRIDALDDSDEKKKLKKDLEDDKKRIQDLDDKSKKTVLSDADNKRLNDEEKTKDKRKTELEDAEEKNRKRRAINTRAIPGDKIVQSAKDKAAYQKRIKSLRSDFEDRRKRIEAFDDPNEKKRLLDELEKDKKRIQDLEDKSNRRPLTDEDKLKIAEEEDTKKKRQAELSDAEEKARQRKIAGDAYTAQRQADNARAGETQTDQNVTKRDIPDDGKTPDHLRSTREVTTSISDEEEARRNAEKLANDKRELRKSGAEETLRQNQEVRDLTKAEREKRLADARTELRKIEDGLSAAEKSNNQEIVQRKAKEAEQRAEEARRTAREQLDAHEESMDAEERKRHQQIIDDAKAARQKARDTARRAREEAKLAGETGGGSDNVAKAEDREAWKKWQDEQKRRAISYGIDPADLERMSGQVSNQTSDSIIKKAEAEAKRVAELQQRLKELELQKRLADQNFIEQFEETEQQLRQKIEAERAERKRLEQIVQSATAKRTEIEIGKLNAQTALVQSMEADRVKAEVERLRTLSDSLKNQISAQSGSMDPNVMDTIDEQIKQLDRDRQKLEDQLKNNSQLQSSGDVDKVDWDKLDQQIADNQKAIRKERIAAAQKQISGSGNAWAGALQKDAESKIAAQQEDQKRKLAKINTALSNMSTGSGMIQQNTLDTVKAQHDAQRELQKKLWNQLEKQVPSYTKGVDNWEDIDNTIRTQRRAAAQKALNLASGKAMGGAVEQDQASRKAGLEAEQKARRESQKRLRELMRQAEAESMESYQEYERAVNAEKVRTSQEIEAVTRGDRAQEEARYRYEQETLRQDTLRRAEELWKNVNNGSPGQQEFQQEVAKELETQTGQTFEVETSDPTRTGTDTLAGDEEARQQAVKTQQEYEEAQAKRQAQIEEEKRLEEEAKAEEQRLRREAEEKAQAAEKAENSRSIADRENAALTRHEANIVAKQAEAASHKVEAVQAQNKVNELEHDSQVTQYRASESPDWANSAASLAARKEAELRAAKQALRQSLLQNQQALDEAEQMEQNGPQEEEKRTGSAPELDPEKLLQGTVKPKLPARIANWIGIVAAYNPGAIVDTLIEDAVMAAKDALKAKLKKAPPPPDIQELINKPIIPKPSPVAIAVQNNLPIVKQPINLEKVEVPKLTTKPLPITVDNNPSKIIGQIDPDIVNREIFSAITNHLDQFAKSLDSANLTELERKLVIDAKAASLADMPELRNLEVDLEPILNRFDAKLTAPTVDIDAWKKEATTKGMQNSDLDKVLSPENRPATASEVNDFTKATTPTTVDATIPEPETVQGELLDKAATTPINTDSPTAPMPDAPEVSPALQNATTQLQQKAGVIPSETKPDTPEVKTIKQAIAGIPGGLPGSGDKFVDQKGALGVVQDTADTVSDVKKTAASVIAKYKAAKGIHKKFKAHKATDATLNPVKRKANNIKKMADLLMAENKLLSIPNGPIRVIPPNAVDNLKNVIAGLKEAGAETHLIKQAETQLKNLEDLVNNSDNSRKAFQGILDQNNISDLPNDVKLAPSNLDEILNFTDKMQNSVELKTVSKQKFTSVESFKKHLQKVNPNLLSQLEADGGLTPEKLQNIKNKIDVQAISPEEFKSKLLKKLRDSLHKFDPNSEEGANLRRQITGSSKDVPIDKLPPAEKFIDSYVDKLAKKILSIKDMDNLVGKGANAAAKRLAKTGLQAAKTTGKLAAIGTAAMTGVGIPVAVLFVLMDLYDIYGVLIDFGIIPDFNEKIDKDRDKIKKEIDKVLDDDTLNDEQKKAKVTELVRDQKIEIYDLRHWFGHTGAAIDFLLGKGDDDPWLYNAMNDEMYREEYGQTEPVKVAEGDKENNFNIRNAGQLQINDSNEKASDIKHGMYINRDLIALIEQAQETLGGLRTQDQFAIYALHHMDSDTGKTEDKLWVLRKLDKNGFRPNHPVAYFADSKDDMVEFGSLETLLNRIPDGGVLFLQEGSNAYPYENKAFQIIPVNLGDIVSGNIPEKLSSLIDSDALQKDKAAASEFASNGPVVANMEDYQNKMKALEDKISELVASATGRKWDTEFIKKFDPLSPIDKEFDYLADTRSEAWKNYYSNKIDLARLDLEKMTNESRKQFLYYKMQNLRERLNRAKEAKYIIIEG